MSEKAVAKFIEVTHKTYGERCRGKFGPKDVVPGIFTDEPNVSHGSQGVAWTDSLPKVYRQRYGGDLLKHLPELFYDVDDRAVSKVRWQYHDCVAQMFSDAFSKADRPMVRSE